MRNISQLAASMVLLATQVNNPLVGIVTAQAATDSSASPVHYEVSLQTNTPIGIVVTGLQKPSYDAAVLNPLHAAEADAAAKAAAAARARAAAQRVYAPIVSVLLPVGSHTDWMAAAGIAASDFGYVDYIVNNESGWGVTKWNYAGSRAYGLGQALPGSKMAPFGADWATNPITQLKWATSYAAGCYGSWHGAYVHWTQNHSW